MAQEGDAVARNGAGSAETIRPPAGILAALSSALAEARTALSSFLDLVTLEARRAGLALMWMVAVGVAAALCVVVAWLGLTAALAMWAVAGGLPPIAAVVLLAAVHLLAGAGLFYLCAGMSRDLLFPATRRQVAGPSRVAPPAP